MTIEEKAKAYDEALERAKDFYKGYKQRDNQLYADDLETIFPELAESEDEKIRKELIKHLKEGVEGYMPAGGSEDYARWLAWLEKQKEYELSKDLGEYVTELNKQFPEVSFAKLSRIAVKVKNWLEKQGELVENNEDDADGDFTIYYPLKTGKGCYECIPYSFYGMLSSFSEDKDMIDFLRLCFYTKEECNEWIKRNESTDICIKNKEFPASEKRDFGYFSEPIDKVAPKFQNGQWIVWQNKCYKVNYNGCGYELIDQNGLSTSLEYGTVDTSARLWDITKDVRNGDVLASKDGDDILIFRNFDTNTSFSSYYNIAGRGELGWSNKSFIPATKEQRDTLMKAMKDAGYEWLEETHELKKISQRIISAEAKEALYDKPAWSEEDMKEALRTEYEKGRADTIAEMKKDWSEEDEKMLDAIIDFFENGTVKLQHDLSLYASWLKSLRPQKQWRPSDEQMEAFEHFVRSIGESGYASPYDNNTKLLYSLLNDLKKLIE